MPLIFKECGCGKSFEAISIRRVYCDDCQKARKKQQSAEAKKRYLQTDKGREMNRKQQRRTYWRNPEKQRAKALEYYEAHREECKEKMRSRAKEKVIPLCVRCKHTFQRVATERICPACLAREAELAAKKAQRRADIAMQQKHLSESKQAQKKPMPLQTKKVVLPTESEKLAMFREALRKHRAAA